jgi:uncharacterized protein YegP (UPF0339 family)
MTNRVTFHKNNRREWIWTVQASNWRIIGRSSEGYKNKQDAIDNFEQLTGRLLDDEFGTKVAFPNPILSSSDHNDWDVVFDD